MDKSNEKRPPAKLSEGEAKSHYSRPESPAIVGTRDDRLTLAVNMNKHFSDAYQVGAQEKTKQAEQETRQAEERTKQAKLEIIAKTYATIGLIGVFLTIALYPAGAWAAVVALSVVWASHSVANIIRASADLTFQRKRNPIALPELPKFQIPSIVSPDNDSTDTTTQPRLPK